MTQLSEKSTPEEKTFKSFERTVSRQRFQRYRRATNTKQEAVALYLWNVALCESLYPPFQFFEIALRNATNQSITAQNGNNARWFMDPSILTEVRHQEQIEETFRLIRKNRKGHLIGVETDPDFPKEPSRVVAELSLGFWVNLFSNRYTATLVQDIAADVFPNGPKEIVINKRQDAIYPRLSEVLDLRNRVFHHEPIYHWTYRTGNTSLKAYHTRLCEVIRWMCQVQPFFLEAVDRFVQVHDAGTEPYLDAASFAFLQDEEQGSKVGTGR